MNKVISSQFKKNGKAVKGKEKKEAVLTRLGLTPEVNKVAKTIIIKGGRPYNVSTGKYLVKQEA